MNIEIVVHRKAYHKIRTQDTPLAHALKTKAQIMWGMPMFRNCILLSCSDLYLYNGQQFVVPALLRHLQQQWNTNKQQQAWWAKVQHTNGVSQSFGRLKVPKRYNVLLQIDDTYNL